MHMELNISVAKGTKRCGRPIQKDKESLFHFVRLAIWVEHLKGLSNVTFETSSNHLEYLKNNHFYFTDSVH